jgi:hypothetical protein
LSSITRKNIAQASGQCTSEPNYIASVQQTTSVSDQTSSIKFGTSIKIKPQASNQIASIKGYNKMQTHKRQTNNKRFNSNQTMDIKSKTGIKSNNRNPNQTASIERYIQQKSRALPRWLGFT